MALSLAISPTCRLVTAGMKDILQNEPKYPLLNRNTPELVQLEEEKLKEAWHRVLLSVRCRCFQGRRELSPLAVSGLV